MVFFFFKIFDVEYLKTLYWICCNIASLSRFSFSGHMARGILVAWPGVELAPPELEGEVSTMEELGKSMCILSICSLSGHQDCFQIFGMVAVLMEFSLGSLYLSGTAG